MSISGIVRVSTYPQANIGRQQDVAAVAVRMVGQSQDAEHVFPLNVVSELASDKGAYRAFQGNMVDGVPQIHELQQERTPLYTQAGRFAPKPYRNLINLIV